jgi:hypothetical protein
MRFSVGENRIKFANATNLNRKSGVAVRMNETKRLPEAPPE